MTERFLLTLFFVCLISCATLVLLGIWIGESLGPDVFKTAASLFVVGLTSFLVWFVPTLRRIAG